MVKTLTTDNYLTIGDTFMYRNAVNAEEQWQVITNPKKSDLSYSPMGFTARKVGTSIEKRFLNYLRD